MKKLFSTFIHPVIIFLCLVPPCFSSAFAQQVTVGGRVAEAGTEEPLTGVNISIEGTLSGTVSDLNGAFLLETDTPLPFKLVFSFIGYGREEAIITSPASEILVEMHPRAILGQEVVISASRVEENIMASPVTIEKMTSREVEQSPAASFYDGLYSIKGVDMNVHSLTFRFPNTRGFTGETNVRMNQLVDGVDNSSPGLSFPAGNIFGLSNIDVEGVELLVGASSALYGPGGMNGVLLMKSKNPFDHEGLTLSLQGGLMHFGKEDPSRPQPMANLDLRYAKSFNDRFAFKITGTYLNATDWFAEDYRDKYRLDESGSTRETNEGYDGVNVYGDDIVVPVNLKEVAPDVLAGVAEARGLVPGTTEYEEFISSNLPLFPDQIITRTGWTEKELVDYNTYIMRFNAAFHYRFGDGYEAILRGGSGQGSSVYTAQNRFAFENFRMSNIQAELNNPDFYVRSYYIWEHSGDSYNAGGAGAQVNEAWKPSEAWYEDYIASFTQQILLGASREEAFKFARLVAENRDAYGNIFNPSENAFPYAGSAAFEEYFEKVINTPIHEGGAKVLDKSSMSHTEGMYDFSRYIPWFDLQAGANYRHYIINSEGTVFADTPGDPILIDQYGGYIQLNREFLNQHLRVTLAARYDKNQYFKGRATPRLSLVYAVDHELDHTIRASAQTAYRFPSIADQWVNLDVGAYRVIGGLPEVHGIYDFDNNPVYPLSSANPVTSEPVMDNGPFDLPEFEPERVTAYEIGYKGLFLNKLLFLDSYAFVNRYNGFLATQVLVQNPYEDDERRFQTPISTNEPVIAWGWALGLEMLLPKGFYSKGNVAYNALESIQDRPPGFQSRFNTPRYRFNLSLGKHQYRDQVGFKISYRWQDTFLWESAFGVAQIPSYATLDAQVSYTFESLFTTLKVGGSNVLNDTYHTSFGSAGIGGLYYMTLVFDGL
jgi:outer membrane receptor protein involved in Fe transport